MSKIYYPFLLCLLLCAKGAQAQIPSYVPADGLVGWWPFTGNAIDSSSFDHDGTVYGATLTTDRFGNANSAYSFDGISNYIDLDTAGLSSDPDTFSASAWFYANDILPDGLDHWKHGVVLTKRHNMENSWATIEITHDSSLVFNVDGPDKANKIGSTDKVVDKKWHHVVVIKQDTNYTIILDGSIEHSGHDAYKHVGLKENMHVGHHGGWRSFFYGKIDDIGIWKRALTTKEVKKLYDAEPTSFPESGMASFAIYPNPVKDILFLENTVPGQSYVLLDMTGKVLRQGVLNNAVEEIPVGDLARGIYFLKVGKGLSQTLKIVKE